MASDLSSGCELSREGVDLADEKEEGEISLEDVSSSEEGQPTYPYGVKSTQCPNCRSGQVCTTRCTVPAKFTVPVHQHRSQPRKDAAHGKENLHYIREPSYTGNKHATSTLQEKNDDLVPISSDSDMEIVGLLDNSVQLAINVKPKSKTKKKKKKKKNHVSVLTVDDFESSSSIDVTERLQNCLDPIKHEENITKGSMIRTHRRNFSPVHKNSRTRPPPRTPPRRHKSPARSRSPCRRSRSPLIPRPRSPLSRRSPRKQKSPKRSPRRSPIKSIARKQSHFDTSNGNAEHPTSHANVQKLLKKVRQLDAVGTHSLEETLNKNKEHASSLKEKLLNMMKTAPDNNTNLMNISKEKVVELAPAKESNDGDDEEDLAMLRQKALETKQKKTATRNDATESEVKNKMPININDDQDEEDLQLRMIALRSAVLKKHRNRVQRGVNASKNKKAPRSESPFTQSFLDSIPIPGEQLLNFASPPHTPPPVNEISHTEDMDLDTDVEREKEKLPYSPTDKITTNIPIDTEMLGIQPSDVSFISLKESANNQLIGFTPQTDGHRFLQSQIVQNQSYLPSTYSHADTINSRYNIISNNNNFNERNSNHTEHGDLQVANSGNQQMPYSPTDTPICDIEIPHSSSEGPVYFRTVINCSALSELSGYDQLQSNQHLGMSNKQFHKNLNNKFEEQHLVEQISGSGTNSLVGSPSPASLITIDDLPESDIDLPSSAGSLKSDIQSEEHIPSSISSNNNVHNVEPLYMQGVPDVSKDSNKIPTLINRTLVPAPILKSNKQLQKPLLIKKPEVCSEPSFKSAEMQPVLVNKVRTTDSSTVFKPMKFPTSVQKVPTLLKPPIAFHDLLQEDFESESHCNKKTPELTPKATDYDENNKEVSSDTHAIEPLETQRDEIATHKKGKAPRKGVKRKSGSSIEILDEGSSKSNGKESKQNKQLTDNSIHTTTETSVCKTTTPKVNAVEKPVETLVKPNLNVIKDNVLTPVNSANLQNCTNVNTQNLIIPDGSVEEPKTLRTRRQSLDEDEDALRAILLASLPKRVKTSDVTSNATSISSPVRMTSAVFNIELKQTTNLTKAKPKTPQRTGAEVENNKNLLTSSNKEIPPNYTVKEVGKNDQTKENDISQTVNMNEAAGQKSVPTVPAKKRPILPNKGPHRKIIKRPPISASTKVVNNAKKYQNAILQKRLNLQKAASVYSNQKLTDHRPMNKVQSNETKWPATGKMNPVADAHRIVINLQSDTESDSDIEKDKNSTGRASVADKAHANSNCATEFEKNLEQFLRDVRKKQESVAAARTAPQTPVLNKNIQMAKQSAANLRTPLAVRHLPASQQAEYRRLKQQILEHEKLKIRRAAEMKESRGTTPTSGSNSGETNQQSLLNKEKENNSIPSVCAKVASSSSKQLSPDTKQNKVQAIPMANLSIRISNENISQTSAVNTPITNTLRTVTESVNGSTPISQETIIKKAPPILRVLTGAEINRKYVQIQVKHDTNERIVTINEQSSPKESTISPTNQNEKPVVCENTSINLPEPVLNDKTPDDDQSIQSGMVDSDASTIVLKKDNQADSTRDSVDASQSTIILSQQKEQNQMKSKRTSDSRVPNNSINGTVKISNEKRVTEGWDTAKKEVKATITALRELSPVTQAQHLKTTEQNLVMKRYSILDELAEMSGNLRQWHMERDLQTLLIGEVKKLREQLRVAEERLQVQRDHIKAIGPKVVAAHKKINAGRQECFKLSKICSALGIKVIGKNYKIPDDGANLLEVRLKEVANHTRQLSRKKEPPPDDSATTNTETMESSPGMICGISSKTSQPPRKISRTDKNNDCAEKILLPNEEDKCCSIIQRKDSEELQFEDAFSKSLEIVQEKTDFVVNESLSQTKEETSIEQESTILYVQPEGSSTPITSKTKKNIQTAEITTDDSSIIPPKSTGMTTSLNKMDEQHCKKGIAPYVSILTHMKVARNANPNGVLCPFELMGTCNDGDCQFIHQIESQAK